MRFESFADIYEERFADKARFVKLLDRKSRQTSSSHQVCSVGNGTSRGKASDHCARLLNSLEKHIREDFLGHAQVIEQQDKLAIEVCSPVLGNLRSASPQAFTHSYNGRAVLHDFQWRFKLDLRGTVTRFRLATKLRPDT